MSDDHTAENDVARGHHLTVTKDDGWDPEWPHFQASITCLNPSKCGGWQECRESHEVAGQPANEGPWESDESAPWYEQDEFTFHGEHHEWRYGYGWTVEFPGCVVAANDGVSDAAHDIGVEHGEGTYDVDDEWDDEYLTLIVTSRVIPPTYRNDAEGAL